MIGVMNGTGSGFGVEGCAYGTGPAVFGHAFAGTGDGVKWEIVGGSGTTSLKVSWQVTGIRQDASAQAHRIPMEEVKPASEKGRYLHPELFGQTQEQRIGLVPRSAVAAR